MYIFIKLKLIVTKIEHTLIYKVQLCQALDGRTIGPQLPPSPVPSLSSPPKSSLINAPGLHLIFQTFCTCNGSLVISYCFFKTPVNIYFLFL